MSKKHQRKSGSGPKRSHVGGGRPAIAPRLAPLIHSEALRAAANRVTAIQNAWREARRCGAKLEEEKLAEELQAAIDACDALEGVPASPDLLPHQAEAAARVMEATGVAVGADGRVTPRPGEGFLTIAESAYHEGLAKILAAQAVERSIAEVLNGVEHMPVVAGLRLRDLASREALTITLVDLRQKLWGYESRSYLYSEFLKALNGAEHVQSTLYAILAEEGAEALATMPTLLGDYARWVERECPKGQAPKPVIEPAPKLEPTHGGSP